MKLIRISRLPTTKSAELRSGADRVSDRVETGLRNDLSASIEKLGSGVLPGYTGDQLIAAEKELNDVYARIQKSKSPSWCTTTREGVKTTQRTWLKYRDAWVAFARWKYPGVSAESWKPWLTMKRVEMVKEFP